MAVHGSETRGIDPRVHLSRNEEPTRLLSIEKHHLTLRIQWAVRWGVLTVAELAHRVTYVRDARQTSSKVTLDQHRMLLDPCRFRLQKFNAGFDYQLPSADHTNCEVPISQP